METKDMLKGPMKKNMAAAGLMLAILLSGACFADSVQKITASVDIYTGRVNPQWEMTPSEVSELKDKLAGLTEAVIPSELPEDNYILVENPGRDPSLPYDRIYFLQGLIITDDGTTNLYLLDDKGIRDWMIELGNAHDPNYVAPKFKTLPPNTPYAAVIPGSFDETVNQGEPLTKKFTLFSEGNAPLQGTIETPGYVTINRKDYSLKAIEGIEDEVFSVDTSKPGVLDGYIVVKSNDPSNPELKIRVRVNVMEKAKVVMEEKGSINYVFYIAFIVLIAAGAFVLYKNNKK